jgi:thioredoxin-like negative regulator of GroEL
VFERRKSYDRKRLLDEALQACAKGRCRRAIGLYRRVLAAEPRNIELHYKVAPLLARTGQTFDAWRSFQQVAKACASGGHHAKALAVYQKATQCLPLQFEAWMAVAKLEMRAGEKPRARDTLIEGRHRMKGRRNRPQAVALLRSALDLDPWHADTVLNLAALLVSSGQSEEARWLLEQLTGRVRGRMLARVRGTQWRMEPSLRNSWYWLRDSIRARRGETGVRATA